jgi:hypothetical protein
MATLIKASAPNSGEDAMEQEHVKPGKNWATPPTLGQVLVLAGVCYLIYLAVFMATTDYWTEVQTFGDNRAYTATATAITHWNLASIHSWQFWGLPYAMVVFSFLTRTSVWTALMFFSIAGSFAAVLICDRLWGGWAAGYFAVISRDWMDRSVLGGAEPLFLTLVFGSFLAVRHKKWLLASLLAALSSTVRPMGIFALAGIGLVLLVQKQYKTLAGACLIGIVVGGLYVAPLKIYRGDPLANVDGYSEVDGNRGKPITYPFAALTRHATSVTGIRGIEDVAAGKMTRLNLARVVAWMAFVGLGVIAMFFNRRFRDLARKYPVEILFCGLYIGLLFTYNSAWARVAFPRYAIPIIPFVILAFEPWIPKDRRLLWTVGIASAVLSAAASIGLQRFVEVVRKML